MTQNQTPPGRIDPVAQLSLNDLSIPDHAVVIVDEDLPDALAEKYAATLFKGALRVSAGESLKTLAALESLAERVLEKRPSRPMTLVGIGGGSVGDAVGFLASVLWRGVGLWHVPTTLLAMVDSAHGGKTAINLGPYKNQIGTFYPAERVAICAEFLDTLPIPQREQGLVELLKALWLDAPDALDLWDAEGGGEALAAAPFAQVQERLTRLIGESIDVKYRIVERDPREELEIRTFLNLGHTVAHALELSIGLSHGHAVAWGMLAAGHASIRHGQLTQPDLDRLFSQLYPLLEPLHDAALPDLKTLSQLLSRDKKTRGGELRSVILDGPGRPRVVTLTPDDWHLALREAHAQWRDCSVRIEKVSNYEAFLTVEASKSIANRAQVIQFLAPAGTVETEIDSTAADVEYLRKALHELTQAPPTDAIEVDAGAGGTTLRFLLAVASDRPGRTRIRVTPRLFERPHEPLLECLRRGGAWIELDVECGTFVVEGWSDHPTTLSINASKSSQFASACALLASGLAPDATLELIIEGTMVSAPYFDMTLNLLEQSGVGIQRTGSQIVFTGRALQHTILECEPDASSAAAWVVLRDLGVSVSVPNISANSSQPDARLGQIIADIRAGAARVDVADCPDIVPVLAAWAVSSNTPLRIEGAHHLRLKESNRIDDLVGELRGQGFDVEALDDGLQIRQQPQETSGTWHTHHDHRLAFAALVVSLYHSLVVSDPWVVRKSYPRFYHDARRLGWSVAPVRPD